LAKAEAPPSRAGEARPCLLLTESAEVGRLAHDAVAHGVERWYRGPAGAPGPK